jgi:hypothetical protein
MSTLNGTLRRRRRLCRQRASQHAVHMKAKNGSNGGRGYVSSMVAKKQIRKPVLKNLKGGLRCAFTAISRVFAQL